jgi:RecB family endonuclease NucS/DNA-binding CsgD family transcriptional regulator
VHLAVVGALTPSADDPDVVAELAHHALAALPAGDRVAATGWARRAAEVAHSRLAYDEAARLLADALAAGRPVLSPAERLSVLLELARARGLAHDVAGAIADVHRGRRAGQGHRRRRGPRLRGARSARGQRGDVARRGAGLVRRGAAGPRRRDSPLKARLLAQVAHSGLFGGDARAIAGAGAAALAMAERLDDPASLSIALRARQLAHSDADGNAERLVLGGRMLALGERTGDPEAVLWGRLWRFDALLQAGRVTDAETELVAVEPVVAVLRRLLPRLHLLRGRVALALGRGRFAEARALNDEAAAIAEQGGHFGASATARSLRIGIAAATGGDPGDLEWLRTHPSRLEPMAALTRGQMTHLLLGRGEQAEAREWYASLPEVGAAQIPSFMVLPLEGMRAQLLPDFGDAPTAEAVHKALLPYADLHLVGGAGAIMTMGSVRLALGYAATVAGKPDVAVRHLRTAVAVDDEAGLAHPATLARHQLAVALRARGRPSDVDESIGVLAQAEAAAERLGMAPLRARIAELRAGADDGGVLSRREAEIAELVGRGLTNRQIAASAHISERTVEDPRRSRAGQAGLHPPLGDRRLGRGPEAVGSLAVRLVIARCQVDYVGRLTAHLPMAPRLLLIKADGSVSIHADDRAYKPLNWMSPPCWLEEAPGVWTVRNKADESLVITIGEVLHDSSHELGVDPGLVKDGVEAHLQELLAAHPATLGEGYTLVRREYMTAIGPVDLLCRDSAGASVAVEVKRRGEIDGVEQLTRYLELMNRDPLLAPVAGVFAAQQIKPQARTLAQDRGIRCVTVNYDALRGMESDDLLLF